MTEAARTLSSLSFMATRMPTPVSLDLTVSGLGSTTPYSLCSLRIEAWSRSTLFVAQPGAGTICSRQHGGGVGQVRLGVGRVIVVRRDRPAALSDLRHLEGLLARAHLVEPDDLQPA